MNKAKFIQAAEQQVRKGLFVEAIAEFKKVIEHEPDNADVLVKIAALFARLDKKEEAVDYYLRAAEQLEQTGFETRAVAVYKRALLVDYNNPALYRRIARVYSHLGMTADALTQSKKALSIFERSENLVEACEMAHLICEMEPGDLDARARFAALLYRTGRKESALEAINEIADQLQNQGNEDELITFYEKIVATVEDDNRLIKLLAGSYVNRFEPVKALMKIQKLLKNKVKDEMTLTLLAEAYRQLGKKDKAVPVLRELAKLYHRQGKKEKIVFVLREVLQLDPANEQARSALTKLGFAPTDDFYPKTN